MNLELPQALACRINNEKELALAKRKIEKIKVVIL